MSYHAAAPKRAIGGKLYELPAPADRAGEPEWVAQARALRRAQWSYQRIADTLGYSYRQVYVRLNRERVRATDKRSDHKHRAKHTATDLRRRRKHAPRCSVCNRRMSKKPKTLPPMCTECRRGQGRARRGVIAGLWLEGLTCSQIAAVIEEPSTQSTFNSIGSTISQMRKQGWDLPRRRGY